MKYLFAAIDARQGRTKAKSGAGRANGVPRTKYNANELKKLLVEASEGVDEKSSTHDFMDTLERIVNEIKNTTEHSGAFLQKVKKTEVPDYYDVITRPMDLATLQKRVKSQMYRTKKAFADDLDLIWSNCLLYNSHPSHPLRRSAEFLRQKSNQLLEFITDPSLPTRTSLFAASVSENSGTGGRSKAGTPAGGEEKDEGEEGGVESGDEEGSRRTAMMALTNQKLMNGVAQSGRDASDSPMLSRSQTPAGQAANDGRPDSPAGPIELAFEERAAIIRTPQSMHDFTLLDDELTRIEESATWNPFTTTSTPLLPPSAYVSPVIGQIPAPTATEPINSDQVAVLSADRLNQSTATSNIPSGTTEQNRLFSLIQSLNPPSPSPCTPTAPGTPIDATSASTPPVTSAPLNKVAAKSSPADALWWETIAAPSSSNALASGLPRCPWVGQGCDAGDEGEERTGRSSVTGKGKMAVKGNKLRTKGKGKEGGKNVKGRKKVSVKGTRSLGDKMKGNVETLNKIRRLHTKLANAAQSAVDPYDQPLGLLSLSDSEDSGTEGRPSIRKKKASTSSSWNHTGIDKQAFASHHAAEAGQKSLGIVSERILSHAGFDATNVTPLGVLAHVAAEYMINLGRTLRFYSDRYNAKLSPEQILLHTLSENGIPSLSHIESYVLDIDKYGTKLNDLHSRLEKSRRDQLEGGGDAAVEGDEELFARDAEALAMGEFGTIVGEDFFGLAEIGLDQELGSTRLAIPRRLFRGEPKVLVGLTDLDLVGPNLKYRPPPPFVPLTPSSISSQIGLLQPIFSLRQQIEAGLMDDFAQPLRMKTVRNKVPATGRIPFKGKRVQDPIEASSALSGSRKRRKRIKKAAAALAAVVEGSESEAGARASVDK